MPITFVVESHRRLVRTTYTGGVTFRDVMKYVDELVDRELLVIPQLIDARAATLVLTEEETRRVADLLATLRRRYGSAPVAFIAGNATSYAVAADYGDRGAGGTPAFSIFADVEAAELWISLSRPPT